MRWGLNGLAVLALALTLTPARAQEEKSEKAVPEKEARAPAPPAPGCRSTALWAALASCVPGLALEDVLAATGLAFRATVCANDCGCLEAREDALALPAAARIFGFEASEVDLGRTPPEQAFARIKASVEAGRAVVLIGPREAGVAYGVSTRDKLFFVRTILDGEPVEEARPLERLGELWELVVLEPGSPPGDPGAREGRILTAAIAHARRPAARGGCGLVEAPALTGWGLSAFGLFAQDLAEDEHGLSGQHTAIAERAALLRAGRAAAVLWLEKVARRREAAKPGSGAALREAAAAYRGELETALAPLEKLLAGKDELLLAAEPTRSEAAELVAKAVRPERAAVAALERLVLAERGIAEPLAAALALDRTAPVTEKLAPDLAKLAQNPDPDLRLLAVHALAETPGPAARAALAAALGDKDGPVAEAALVALETRGEPGLVELFLKAWDEPPLPRARSDRPLRRSLLFALADRAAGDPAALARVEKALEEPGEADEVPDCVPRWAASLLYGIQGVDAEPALLAAMKSKHPGARRGASAMLDLSGSREALAALDAALADPDAPTRLTAAAALGRRGQEKGLKTAFAGLRDAGREVRSAAIEALARIGAPALPGLAKLLQDPDWRVRANACVVLSRTGGTPELERVAALANDPEPNVQHLAREAKATLEARARAAKSEEEKK